MKNVILLIFGLFVFTLNTTDAQTKGGNQTHDPTWPAPEGAVDIKLSKKSVSRKGELIKMDATIDDLKLLQDGHLPDDFPLLTIVLEIEDPNVVSFSDGKSVLEHNINPDKIDANGTYTFSNDLIGYRVGSIKIRPFWKWRIATEGCCSVSLSAIAAGCAGAANITDCVCSVMANMPAPGSYCCSIHPKMFRYWWTTKFGCGNPGTSPY